MSMSIRSRVFRLTFSVSILLSSVLLAFSWWALEDLEQSVLMSERDAEILYFDENGDKTRPHKVVTSQVTTAFIPHNADNETLPVLFTNIPVPFQGEIEFLDKEYFVVTQALPEGNYYLAKSLMQYEQREDRLIYYTLVLALVMICGCYVLASIFSRRIVRPTELLEKQIIKLDTQDCEARLTTDYIDQELNEIAQAINAMLQQIQATAKRERSLISMASHELRTPVSVIMGAARIMEKRNNLNADDHKTLMRILGATEDMSSNIRALLAVVRQTPDSLVIEDIDLAQLLQQLHSNYDLQGEFESQRLSLDIEHAGVIVKADKALVRMMLHNLISNALNHTQGAVCVSLDSQSIQIQDQGGPGSDTPLNLPADYHPGSGLGLYIVTLICERLGWKLVLGSTQQGNNIRILF